MAPPTPKLDPAIMLVMLRDTAEAKGRRGVVRALEELAQDILFRIDRPQPWGSVDVLSDKYGALSAQVEGRGGGEGGRSGNPHSREAGIVGRADVDEEILRRLGTWRRLHRFLEEHGLGHLIQEATLPRCKACESSYALDINRLLLEEWQTPRHVEVWLQERGESISWVTLNKHKGHAVVNKIA